jgi:hypothetical protein
MDNTTFFILYLLVIIVASIVAHTFMRNLLRASVISGIGSTMLLETIGPSDALWLVGFVIGSAGACGISLIVGLIIDSIRKKSS